MAPRKRPKAYNLFGVPDSQYEAINDWLDEQHSLPPDERMSADQFPPQFSQDVRSSCQVAYARIFSERPYLFIGGTIALCVIPFLLIASWIF